jgi:hypothetical protein
MKLLLDDKQHRGFDLNANEACIFAAILKCTRAGRGWYGNYRELAAAMPFVINHSTVYRAIQKLLNLGLIERRDEKLFALLQNETELLHSETELLQNKTELLQNALPPNNPPINNNMNENKEEQQRALCARDCEEQQDCLFEKFWKFFSVAMPSEFHNRKGATKVAFEQRSEVAQRAMVEAAQEGAPGHPGDASNPYFFVVDFPEPQPYFLSGVEQDNCHIACIPLVQVKHNGKFLICTRETMELFGLEWVRDW